MADPRFEGQTLKLGDREFVVPPLNWKRIRKLLPVLERIRSVGPVMVREFTEAMLDDYIEVIYEAVSRNYPEVTRDELEDLVDLVTAPQVFMAVMGQSGLAQGEPAPGMEGALTGESSTQP
jgi:hypothetical protein